MKVILPLLALGEHFSTHWNGDTPYRQLDGNHTLGARAYTGLELANRLQVLLISDPKALMAGAAVVVSSGSQNDPAIIPGLAHFCLRMVCWGKDYRRFVEANSGRETSLTTYEHSLYSFQVGAWALDTALGLLAELFTAPAFDREGLAQEAAIIERQFQNSPMHDQARFNHATHAALNTTHRYAEVLPGTMETLIAAPTRRGLDLHDMVMAYYYENYSANLMRLVVLGREDLESLKQMFIPKFSPIPDTDLREVNRGSPYTSHNLAMHVAIDTPKGYGRIIARFALKPLANAYRLFQLEFLQYLLNSGALADVLASRGLAVFVYSEVTEILRGFATFDVVVYATHRGQRRKRQLLLLLFAYLDAIRTQGITIQRYQEFVTHASPEPVETTHQLVSRLATRLHQFRRFSAVLGRREERFGFYHSSLQDTLRQFQPSNCILYEEKDFEGAREAEPWYGASFATSPFSRHLLAALSSVSAKSFNITLPKIRYSAHQ